MIFNNLSKTVVFLLFIIYYGYGLFRKDGDHMAETIINAAEVFEKYGLEVEEIEPEVYRVLNTEKVISVDELQWELESCILITSDKTGYKKLNSGINSRLAYVYYVITDYDKDDLGCKYDDIATGQFGESLYRSYQYRAGHNESIDTIYAEGEI